MKDQTSYQQFNLSEAKFGTHLLIYVVNLSNSKKKTLN
jgi:hypothetical protein